MESSQHRNTPQVLGVGSPLVDWSVPVDEAFLRRLSGSRGGTIQIDPAAFRQLLDTLPAPGEMTPGGAAANTIRTLAELGISTSFFGKTGTDETGNFFRKKLRDAGVNDEFLLKSSSGATGCCLSIVSPDGERTMRSTLGVSMEISAEEAEAIDYSRFALLYVEGYMLLTDFLRPLLKTARKANCRIVMDLSSMEIVRRYRAELPELLTHCVDIVIANESEAAELFPAGTPLERQLEALSGLCGIAVVKRGAQGALIRQGRKCFSIPAEKVENPVDTTGAGDSWAAGFLYGLLQRQPLTAAGRAGVIVAGEMVKIRGAELPASTWKNIRQRLNSARN